MSEETFDVAEPLLDEQQEHGDSGSDVFEESPMAEVFYSSDDDLGGSARGSSADSILFSSEEERDYVRPPPAKRARYRARSSQGSFFLGKSVCQAALAALIGVGNSTLAKIRNGQKAFTNSSRPSLPKHPMFGFCIRGIETRLWEGVIVFLYYLYQTCAEVMPNLFRNAGEQTLETPFPEDSEEAGNSDAVARLVNGLSQTLQSQATDIEANMIGPGTFRGPLKALPHGSRTELFWEYVAWADAKGDLKASYSQFMRVANPILKPSSRNTGHLRFRKKSEHAQCDRCFTLKKAIGKAKKAATRQSLQEELHQHVLVSWLCRQVYWALRSLSHTTFAAVVGQNARRTWDSMAVGMDQAKFKLPRVRSRSSKLYSKLCRPRLHVAAVWCHGAVLSWYVSDEDTRKNSSTQCEMISRSLDMILDRFGAIPPGISIQMDNTAREGKNQYFTAYLGLVVALGCCRWALASYLLVGHSCLI